MSSFFIENKVQLVDITEVTKNNTTQYVAHIYDDGLIAKFGSEFTFARKTPFLICPFTLNEEKNSLIASIAEIIIENYMHVNLLANL